MTPLKKCRCILFIPSSLMFSLPEQFFMLMFAHLLLTPFDNASHVLTSF